MATGIDFAFNPHPSIAVEKANGVTFVCRYISPNAVNDVNGKNLIPAEKTALLAAGLSLVMVFESGPARMKSGHAAGVADAQESDAVVKALGMTGTPVYFACDFDATPADQVAINAYLDGAVSVLGKPRVGIYGGYYPVKRALDAGKCTYAWQTYAWSGGQWDSRAQLRQVQNGVTVGGADADRDVSQAADFGQFPRPVVAPPVPPAKTWQAWTATGVYSLADFAKNVAGTDVVSLLMNTYKHYGKLDAATVAYLTGLAEGTVSPADKIQNATFWVFA